MLLTEQDVAKDLGVTKDKLRKLITEGKILAVSLNPGSQKRDYRIPDKALEMFKQGLSLDEVKSILYQKAMCGGHGGDLARAVNETEERQRESNPLVKLWQLIKAGGELSEENRKIMDAYHCIQNELLFTGDEQDLEKVTNDLQNKYPEMSVEEIHSLLANVRGWMKEMGL